VWHATFPWILHTETNLISRIKQQRPTITWPHSNLICDGTLVCIASDSATLPLAKIKDRSTDNVESLSTSSLRKTFNAEHYCKEYVVSFLQLLLALLNGSCRFYLGKIDVATETLSSLITSQKAEPSSIVVRFDDASEILCIRLNSGCNSRSLGHLSRSLSCGFLDAHVFCDGQ
jgi:hypothetical protein